MYLSCASKPSDLNMAIESISRHQLCALVLLVIISANLVQSVFVESLQKPCDGKKTCHECIQSKGCAWCALPDFGERCFQQNTSSLTGTCPENYTFNPRNVEILKSSLELTRSVGRIGGGHGGGQYQEASYEEHSSSKGRHFKSGFEQESYNQNSQSAYSGSHRESSQNVEYGYQEESGKIVQIKPQRVGLQLRISMFNWTDHFRCKSSNYCRYWYFTDEAHNLQIKYSQAHDYPVDLYYLMDLSKSMEDDKKSLSDLGDLLSSTMRKLTSNFRLGFGSFVDKVLMPYVSTVPKK